MRLFLFEKLKYEVFTDKEIFYALWLRKINDLRKKWGYFDAVLYRSRMCNYYSQEDNYINVAGTVMYISYVGKRSKIIII